MLRRSAALPLALLAASAAMLAAGASPPRGKPLALQRDATALAAEVQAVVAELGPKARAAVWLSAPLGPPALAWNVDEPMPVASAIKVGYLVELFAAHPGALDAPLPGAAAVLADEKHPAVAHFRSEQRTAAQQALGDASVRRVGEAMIMGKGVDNAAYNIAANVVTAHFGGPARLEAKLHGHGEEWQGLRVRRYMLANRRENGDNEATARALAAVHGALAARSVRGVDARAVDAARAVLARADDSYGRHRFAKGGSLDTDPVTRVAAGWREGPRGSVVHVVMLEQHDVGAGEGVAAGQRLAQAVQHIEMLLFAAAP